MFRQFSLDALKAARAELDTVNVSHVETLLRAALPLIKEILDNEIEAMSAKPAAAPAPVSNKR